MAALQLQVVHRTRYVYEAPVALAHHRAHLQPLADAQQALLEHALEITPAPAHRRASRDPYGNVGSYFHLPAPHASLLVQASSRVEVRARFAALEPQASPCWRTLAERLRYSAGAAFVPTVEFVQPSPFVPRLAALRDYAADSFAAGRPLAAAALELMHRVHADVAYRTASTTIDTPLEQVWTQKSGVCQDFAHLMLGALRMLGLPARYVSGYLLTRAPGAAHDMVGADASHAWVQVWCPGTPGVPGAGWLDLDPTNDVVPGTGHVRLAVGRDYGDVTPLRGIVRGGAGHRLTVGVTTRVLAADAPAAPGPA